MKITPIEIKQKTFEKAFRGYEKQEVHAFLASLAKEWERLQTEYKDLKTQLEQTQKEVAKLREVEESLFKTLKTAEDTRTNLIEQASKTADLHMKETQIKTDALLHSAKNRAKDMLEKTEDRAAAIVENAQKEIRKMQKNYAAIDQHREQLISSLKIISQDILDKLKRMENMPASLDMGAFEEHLVQIKHLQGEASLDADAGIKALDKARFAKSGELSASQAKVSKRSVKASSVRSVSTSSHSQDTSASFFDELA